MRFAIIEKNQIVNAVEADDLSHIVVADGQTAMAWDAAISAAHMAGGAMVPPVVVPPAAARQQFFQQLAVAGKITQDEALVALASPATFPASVAAAVAALPAEQQFAAKAMLIAGPIVRAHPVVAQMLGADADAFFIAAAQL